MCLGAVCEQLLTPLVSAQLMHLLCNPCFLALMRAATQEATRLQLQSPAPAPDKTPHDHAAGAAVAAASAAGSAAGYAAGSGATPAAVRHAASAVAAASAPAAAESMVSGRGHATKGTAVAAQPGGHAPGAAGLQAVGKAADEGDAMEEGELPQEEQPAGAGPAGQSTSILQQQQQQRQQDPRAAATMHQPMSRPHVAHTTPGAAAAPAPAAGGEDPASSLARAPSPSLSADPWARAVSGGGGYAAHPHSSSGAALDPMAAYSWHAHSAYHAAYHAAAAAAAAAAGGWAKRARACMLWDCVGACRGSRSGCTPCPITHVPATVRAPRTQESRAAGSPSFLLQVPASWCSPAILVPSTLLSCGLCSVLCTCRVVLCLHRRTPLSFVDL